MYRHCLNKIDWNDDCQFAEEISPSHFVPLYARKFSAFEAKIDGLRQRQFSAW